MEDGDRYNEEAGYMGSDSDVNRRIRDHFNQSRRDVLERAKKIAFSDFAPQGPGESISVAEIRRRLSEIRDTGYNVPTYSNLRKPELWRLYLNVKREIKKESESSS